jgi:hypothetical protein
MPSERSDSKKSENAKRKPSESVKKLRRRLVVKRRLARRRPRRRSERKRKKRPQRTRQRRNESPKKRLKRTDLPRRKLKRIDLPNFETKRRRPRRTRLPGKSVLPLSKLDRLLFSESERSRNSRLLLSELLNRRKLLLPRPNTLKRRLERLILSPFDLAHLRMLPHLSRSISLPP